MAQRKPLPKEAEAEVLVRSMRRCCLCFFHEHVQSVRRGQIAHLNRDRADHSEDNLVWLCLDHHADYDSRSSQTKGWKVGEVRHWRNKLYAQLEQMNVRASELVEDDVIHLANPKPPGAGEREFGDGEIRWRFPLWQIADRPEFFAYRASNRADGVCVIERIDLPDGRIVVACMQVPGNPGNSITNTVETICQQVCERFEIPFERLVWLENYEYFDPDEWKLVTFGNMSPDGGVSDPTWKVLQEEDWKSLWLRPRRRLRSSCGDLVSKLVKLFPWPPDDYMLG